MDYQLVGLFGLLPAFILGFAAGRALSESPSEEEMLRRIVQGRINSKIANRVELDLNNELGKLEKSACGEIPNHVGEMQR